MSMAVGIIIAAGKGTRMGRLTRDKPKCMLPVAGRPLIHHTIDRLREAGCGKIVVVAGYKSDCLSVPDCIIAENPDYASNNILHSLLCVREYLSGEVVCSYSDIWLEPEILADLCASPGNIVAAVDVDWEPYYAGRSDHPLSKAENAFLGADDSVRRIGKHLTPTAAGDLRCGEFLGLWRMSAAGTRRFVERFDQLDAKLAPSAPFQNAAAWRLAYITDLFQDLIDQGAPIMSSITRRRWAELDTAQDYERLAEIAQRQWLSSYTG
jgi:choline kinase